ncbi:SAV_2336 N-terminal domain-related protein [Streptomyces sp. NBC_00728]|uniref:SAV_2336 N-terminal domain-related protein n=1 Tax=Streptomyces sp. NBC_00728 TaxID=2903676 RepID=UPI00386386A3
MSSEDPGTPAHRAPDTPGSPDPETPEDPAPGTPARPGPDTPARPGPDTPTGPGADPAADPGPALLAELLGRAGGGEPPTSVELAELLWLAGHIEGPAVVPPAAPRSGGRPAGPRTPPAAPVEPARTGVPPEPPSGDPPAGPARPDDGRVPLRLPGSDSGPPDRDANGAGRDAADDGPANTPHTTLLAPAPPMLPHPLALQRTLRPLKRRVPAPVGHILDEEATADRIARLGAVAQWWLPVLRPATERWLTLHLVHDTGPTMPVWRPLVRELHSALAQSGVFRTVELHRLTAGGTVRRPGSQESYADGRTVTLLVSDCTGAQWRDGPAGTRWYRTLRRWAARMPVAVLQPLPERLWRTTALPATTARLTAPWPAAPNSAYTVDSYASDDLPGPGRVLALPVLEPSARWLANWSSLVAGGGRLPGSVAMLDTAPVPAPLDEHGRGDVERLSPEELVLRFRSLASPEAFRLAGHLAVGRPELPVMRLVHAAIEPSPRPQHLAEVILSGLLSTGPSGQPGSYVFRPGVRELLLHTLPRSARSRTGELLGRVGALIDARAGVAAGEFPVVAPGPGDATADGEAFASVREESVRRLGGGTPDGRLVLGRYRITRRLGRRKRLWVAVDTRLDRDVVLHEYDVEPRWRQRFTDEVGALAAIEQENVIKVYDFGFDGDTPYLVTELLGGASLAELTAEGGFRLPFTTFALLARQVALALRAVHAQGLTHGWLSPIGLVLTPDGTFRVSDFALGRLGDRDESKDLASFGRLLADLAGGTAPDELVAVPEAFRPLVADAIGGLRSASPAAQHRGLDLLLAPSFDVVLEAAARDRYQYRLLGPVGITRGGRTLPPLHPEEQSLLGMLLLHQGRTVTYDILIDGLWRGNPPDQPRRRLATRASGLRKALGPGVLATTATGYALHAPPGTIDVHRCQQLAADSRSRREAGDTAAARTLVQEAIGLWHGTPLADVPGPAADGARARLRALRLSLCATRAELDLEIGDFGRAATDLGELLRSHPRREDFRRLHLLALRGQGRISEAIESYQAYEDLQAPSPPDPMLLELFRELRAAPERGSPVIAVEYTADSVDDPHTHSVLGRTLAWLLSLSDLAPTAYELLSRDNGYVVITEPEVSVVTVLNSILRELPGALLELVEPPKIRVTFWHTALFAGAGTPTVPPDLRPDPDRPEADILVVLSPVLHEELTGSGATPAPERFRPLRRPAPADGSVTAWYCALDLPERLPDPEPVQRDLVRGPFTIRDLTRLRGVEQGRTAVVHTDPDASLTLLDLDRPQGKRPPRSLITYYEVDLTTHGAAHELHLPSSGRGSFAASVELSWHVDDPVAFVRGETHDVSGRLLDHLVKEAGRITRRHPLRRAGAAQRAVHEGLRRWPVPGLSVACSVRLSEGTPAPGTPAPDPDPTGGSVNRDTRDPAPPQDPRRSAARDGAARERSVDRPLRGAECVLLGFDGTLTELFHGVPQRRVAHELGALLMTLRGREEASTRHLLLPDGASSTPPEQYVDPFDLLRDFAHHRLGADLRRELDRIEARLVRTARPIPYADDLIRTLAADGRGPAVVTDTSARAAVSYLQERGLADRVTGGVHGRSDDLGLLMPHPDSLERALDELGVAAPQAVFLGSTPTELESARRIGLPFVGHAPDPSSRRRLADFGCPDTVASLEEVLAAVGGA